MKFSYVIKKKKKILMALIPMVDDFNAKVNNKAYDGFMIVVMAFMTLILWLAVVLLFPLPSVALKNQRRWGG